jgi:chemotaxis protein CheD
MPTTTQWSPPASTGRGAGARIVVGIGELAISDSPDDVIVTHALGSCIAVCLWDPQTRVAGLLHFLLPEAKLNPDRARRQPATFADAGIPLLFQAAYARGLDKQRCVVKLAGGADVAGLQGVSALNVGKRNLLMARQILWQNGILVTAESTGGTFPRTVNLRAADGVVEVTSGREMVVLL